MVMITNCGGGWLSLSLNAKYKFNHGTAADKKNTVLQVNQLMPDTCKHDSTLFLEETKFIFFIKQSSLLKIVKGTDMQEFTTVPHRRYIPLAKKCTFASTIKWERKVRYTQSN